MTHFQYYSIIISYNQVLTHFSQFLNNSFFNYQRLIWVKEQIPFPVSLNKFPKGTKPFPVSHVMHEMARKLEFFYREYVILYLEFAVEESFYEFLDVTGPEIIRFVRFVLGHFIFQADDPHCGHFFGLQAEEFQDPLMVGLVHVDDDEKQLRGQESQFCSYKWIWGKLQVNLAMNIYLISKMLFL